MRKKYKKWSDEKLHAEALKYETRNEFAKESPNAYMASYSRGILNDVCSHMGGNVKWSDELLRNEAMKYKTRKEFENGSPNAYHACCRRGILDDVCSHMKIVNTYWSDEMLRDEALKYETRGDFQKGSVSAYNVAHRRGILDDVCRHMEYVYTYWSDEMLRDEALKYKTRWEFEKGSSSAYDLSRKRGIFDDICRHMEKPPHRVLPHCVYLIEIYTIKNELYYYVGQTSDLSRRLNEHFDRKGSDTTVSDFLNKTPKIKYKKHYIVKNNISYKESLELERETIKDLKDRGIKLLNKVLYLD